MSARLIPASLFRSRCAKCGAPIDKGAPCWYDRSLPKGSRTRHQGCQEQPDQAPQPQPAEPSTPSTPLPTGGHVDGVHWLSRAPKYYRRHFDSIGDYAAYGEHGPAVSHAHNRAEQERVLAGNGKGEHWYGVADVQAARRAMAQGWPEGVARMLAGIKELSNVPQPRNVKRKLIRADQGDEFDIHAAYCGRLDRAWTRRARREVYGSRNVRLVADVLDNASVDAATIFWRGAAVLRLADMLTEAGYNVEIWAGFAGQGCAPGITQVDTVCVKAPTAPMDLNALAAALCMTGFARVWGFLSIMRAADECGHDVNCSYGSHLDMPEALREKDENQYVTPTLNNPTQARAWVEGVIRSLDQGGERRAA